MRDIVYEGPSDTFDARPLFGDDPKFVFQAPGNLAAPAEQRGARVRLTNEQADELLTYPGHRFRLADEAPVAPAAMAPRNAAAIRAEVRAELRQQGETTEQEG